MNYCPDCQGELANGNQIIVERKGKLYAKFPAKIMRFLTNQCNFKFCLGCGTVIMKESVQK